MWKDEPGHQQATCKEARGGNHGRHLQVGYTHDGVARCATFGIAGAEAHAKSAHHYQQEALQGENGLKIEQPGGVQSGKIFHAHGAECSNRIGRNLDGVGILENGSRKESAANDAYGEHHTPQFLLPVVFKIIGPVGNAGCANVF